MAYHNLGDFISLLEQHGELTRISEYVDPRFEMAEITDRVVKNNGPALLFENNGTEFPVLINAFGSTKRTCLALGVSHLDEPGKEIEALFAAFAEPRQGFWEKLKLLPKLGALSGLMPYTKNGRGACQEMVMAAPDLGKLPVLTCWPHDGGPFITFPVVHTIDPETGLRNAGMYRMQVFGKDVTGMHWHLHKGSARHYRKYQKLGKKMPVSVSLGGDPVYTYAATAPLPENVDEYMLAGFLRKKKVSMVRCLTNELTVPEDVDIVIEGYVDPGEPLMTEGPFGDHTGYYSLPDLYPAFHVTCITWRKNAVYPATIVGIPPQEDLWMGKATERIFLTPIRLAMVPEIEDMLMPAEGVFHNLVIASIKSEFPGNASKVMNSFWGAGQMMFNKVLVVVDAGFSLCQTKELIDHIMANFNPATDVYFTQGPLDVLDHSGFDFAFGGKMGVDATGRPGDRERGGSGQKKKVPVGGENSLNERVEGEVNINLYEEGIPVVILSMRKERKGQVWERAESLLKGNVFPGLKVLVFIEDCVDPHDLSTVVWKVGNNIDPVRDCRVLEREGPDACLVIDGTRKTTALDGFSRPWPNVIVSDEKTIHSVDAKWLKLGLGPPLPSPSLRFRGMVYGEGAMAGE